MERPYYYIQLDKPTKGNYDAFLVGLEEFESRGAGGYHAINSLNYLGKYQIGAKTLEDTGYYVYNTKDTYPVVVKEKTVYRPKWEMGWQKQKNISIESIYEFLGLKDNCPHNKYGYVVNPYIRDKNNNKIIDPKMIDYNRLEKAKLIQEDAVRIIHQKKLDGIFFGMTAKMKSEEIRIKYSNKEELIKLLQIGEKFEYEGKMYTITISGLIAASHLTGQGKTILFLKDRKISYDANKVPNIKYMAKLSGYDMTDLFNYIPINKREKYVKGAVVNSGTTAKADIKEEKPIKNDKKAKETDKNRSDASYQTFLNPQYENLNDQFSNDKLRTSDDVGPTKKNAEKLNNQDNSEYKTVKKDSKGKIIIRNFNTKDFELYIPNFKIEGIEEKIEEKKEEGKIAQKTEIDFGSFDGNIVCNLARLECSKKSAMGMLKIDSKPVTINGENIAEASDSIAEKNIIMTGSCGNKPCKVVTSGKWQNTIKYFLSKDEVVSTNSTIKCTSGGGTISIKIPWQKGIGHQVFGAEEKQEEKKDENSKEEENKNKTKKKKPKPVNALEDKSVGKKAEKKIENQNQKNTADELREKIVEEATYWIGKIPYCINGIVRTQVLDRNKPPKYMDCADFSSSVYLTVLNIDIGGNCVTQITRGTKVELKNIKKGDLVLFDWDYNGEPNHVGIYKGDNEMIHESGNNDDPNNLPTGKRSLRKESIYANWSNTKIGKINEHIISIRRIIQDDGSIEN